jgi:quercetin dioxygenase-like cupin family protein
VARHVFLVPRAPQARHEAHIEAGDVGKDVLLVETELPREVRPIRGKHRREHRQSERASRHSQARAALAKGSGENHARHKKLHRHERRAERVVHRHGLRRHDRDAVRHFARLSASSVHFTPGARTAWHTHPNGQTIYVLEGVGLAQRRGGTIEVIQPGDRVFFEPGEEHWHGAAPNRFMTHLAMLDVDDEGNNATRGEHVTDEEYNAAPTSWGRE